MSYFAFEWSPASSRPLSLAKCILAPIHPNRGSGGMTRPTGFAPYGFAGPQSKRDGPDRGRNGSVAVGPGGR